MERSRQLVLLNLGPLNMLKSRNSTRESDMLHMNLSVGCALFILSRKSGGTREQKCSTLNTKPLFWTKVYPLILAYILPVIVYSPVNLILTATLMLCCQNPLFGINQKLCSREGVNMRGFCVKGYLILLSSPDYCSLYYSTKPMAQF